MVLPSMRLDGKVALVTGAGSGLGRAIAMAVAEAGADCVVTELPQRDRPAWSRLARPIARPAAAPWPAPDAARPGQHRRAGGRRPSEEFGRIDILVNNAGRQHPPRGPGDHRGGLGPRAGRQPQGPVLSVAARGPAR